ncbi:MAG: sulfatase [Lentisphaeria bacterium]|nr:sulfatase [Lentisphaeria bacterium]
MKAILVMYDSLNRHMLEPYGCDWVHTPNFRRLAERTVTFDRARIGSSPTIPTRRDLHTGRYNFLHRGWGPLEPFDNSMPEILREAGVYTSLISDGYHYWEDGGATYHGRYNTWEFARGQEADAWKGVVTPESRPGPPRVHERCTRRFITEEHQWPQAQTFAAGIEWLRRNHREERWFLQIETFDPHEPYYVPRAYQDLYPHTYDGPEFIWPSYKRVDEPPEKVRHCRSMSAALHSMCDAYLGKVLDLMDELDLWRDTFLIVNTDHGFLLGEHGWWGKMLMPFYEEVSHMPLFLWDPRCGVRGERRQALVQNIDVTASLLEFFGVDRPAEMRGRPLRDTIASDAPVHEAVLFGMHGKHVYCTDGRYVYMRAPATPDNGPLYQYTMMPTHMRARFPVGQLQEVDIAGPFPFTRGCRLMRIPTKGPKTDQLEPTTLWDLEQDPGQERPVRDAHVEARMVDHMIRLMREHDAPEEQFLRLGLPR